MPLLELDEEEPVVVAALLELELEVAVLVEEPLLLLDWLEVDAVPPAPPMPQSSESHGTPYTATEVHALASVLERPSTSAAAVFRRVPGEAKATPQWGQVRSPPLTWQPQA